MHLLSSFAPIHVYHATRERERGREEERGGEQEGGGGGGGGGREKVEDNEL